MFDIIKFFRTLASSSRFSLARDDRQAPDPHFEEYVKLCLRRKHMSVRLEGAISSLSELPDNLVNEKFLGHVEPVLRELQELVFLLKQFEGGDLKSHLESRGIKSELSSGLDAIRDDNELHTNSVDIVIRRGRLVDIRKDEGFDVPSFLIRPEAHLEQQSGRSDRPFLWEASITSSFKKSYRNISSEVRSRILEGLEDILATPVGEFPSKSKPLGNDKKGLWSYRIGKFRVLYEMQFKSQKIIFIDVSARKDAYRKI